MKYSRILLLLITFGTLFLASCTKPSDASGGSPNIVVTPNYDQSEAPGTVVPFTVSGSSNITTNIPLAKLTIVVVNPNGSTATVGNVDTTFPANITFMGTQYTYTVPVTAKAGDIYTFNFTLTDIKGNSIVAIYHINVFKNIYESDSVNISAQGSTTYGNFYDTKGGAANSPKGAQLNSFSMDFAYYFTTTDSTAIGAPADSTTQAAYNGAINWANPNATTFKKASFADYTNSSSSASLENLYVNSPATESSRVTHLVAGSTVAFRTALGKYGIFTVLNVTAGTTGYIKISSKVQQ